jgi:hypothetical protein
MAQLLEGSSIECETAWLVERSNLSARQLSSSLPQGLDMMLKNRIFKDLEAFADYDLILTSRLFPPLRDMLRHRADRPAVLAFQGGLDFDPERGFFNRRNADGVFLVPESGVNAYHDWAEAAGYGGAQYVGFGHPTFLRPEGAARPSSGDVYFFAQAISPLSVRARVFILQMLAAIARANPARTVWLKLRHLPSENTAHLHREAYPYPSLMAAAGAEGIPNLKLTADPIETVLPNVGIGITCTSTAAVDLIREGVPTMLYLDYPEHYLDPLVPKMREMFDDSGLITPLEQVLQLAPAAPNPAWLSHLFCDRADLVQQIYDAHAHFLARPDLTRRITPAREIPTPDLEAPEAEAPDLEAQMAAEGLPPEDHEIYEPR